MQVSSTALVVFYYVLFLCNKVNAVIQSDSGVKSFINDYHNPHPHLNINKVSLTQKGYIQFLRYIIDVPPLTDYTFCIWLNSENYTHPHPLLSYSKHEKERLIRVWLSPQGKEINLEILGKLVFKIPSNFLEHHWYYICQSWSTGRGAWSLFLNGKLKYSGFDVKLQGAVIKGGGDIVIGQEFTDFDKGLDDGIEGDVFGFNFVLDSAPYPLNKAPQFPYRRQFQALPPVPPAKLTYLHQMPPKIISDNTVRRISNAFNPLTASIQAPFTTRIPQNVITILAPTVATNYFEVPHSRQPRGIIDAILNLFRPDPKVRLKTIDEFNKGEQHKLMQLQNFGHLYPKSVGKPQHVHHIAHQLAAHSDRDSQSRILSEIRTPGNYPSIAMALIELGNNCALGKGAPVNGKKVLISWTKTPVRVFGGAMLKPIPPFCATNKSILR